MITPEVKGYTFTRFEKFLLAISALFIAIAVLALVASSNKDKPTVYSLLTNVEREALELPPVAVLDWSPEIECIETEERIYCDVRK